LEGLPMISSLPGPDDIRKKIEALKPWFHNLHLPGGQQTAPDHFLGDFPSYKWREIAPCLPGDLSGWSALDIGCNAGFYTFELAKRGASVTALDSNATYLAQARWAAEIYGLQSRIEFRQMQIYELAHCQEKWDLILFMGVFYHLRYPLLGLDTVAQKVGRLMIFQTLTMPGDEVLADTDDRGIYERERMCHPGWPKMAFIEGRLADDPTNWWAPNHAAAEAMLRSAGLRVTGRPGKEVYLCEPDPHNPSCITDWGRAEYLAATGLSRSNPAHRSSS
jgi:tRNA (mo5U34)-methyltransferase